MGKAARNPMARWLSTPSRVAAVAIILLTCAGGLYFHHHQYGERNLPAPELVYKEYATKAGENIEVTLADGSIIRLNGGSTLRFLAHFTDKQREVFLSGEAYCEIAKDKERPFLVTMDDYHVQVFGTTFNVNAYPGDEELSVALVEGSVSVLKEAGDNILLEPGKKVAFQRATGNYTKGEFCFEEELGWKDKVFRFRNTPLPEVYQQLHHRYGVSFEAGGLDVSDIRINASFNDTPFSTIITALEEATELSHQVLEGKRIIVTAAK